MLDISWGELAVMTGLCMALVGRKDLPHASRFVGSQVGRVVGLLQGARMRADRFAAQNELRQLQNELRAGLRELDAVRAEIVTTASTRGTIGRGLGATVASANRIDKGTSENTVPTEKIRMATSSGNVANPAAMSEVTTLSVSAVRPLAPRSQAVAAVAENEWEKQGIGFRSRAEQGSSSHAGPTGAQILANLLQESLIYDQHDRVIQEQDEALRQKVEDAQGRIDSPDKKETQ